MKRERNKWGGEDITGPSGVARWVRDDTDTVVYFFTTNMLLVWDCRFSGTTPPHVVEAAIVAARVCAEKGTR